MNALHFHIDWCIVLALGTRQSLALGYQCWSTRSKKMLSPDVYRQISTSNEERVGGRIGWKLQVYPRQ